MARTLVSGEALDSAVRVINVSEKEYVIQYAAELGEACEATVTLDMGVENARPPSKEEDSTNCLDVYPKRRSCRRRRTRSSRRVHFLQYELWSRRLPKC